MPKRPPVCTFFTRNVTSTPKTSRVVSADGLRLNATDDDSIIFLLSHRLWIAPSVGYPAMWGRLLFVQSPHPRPAESQRPRDRVALVRTHGPSRYVRCRVSHRGR